MLIVLWGSYFQDGYDEDVLVVVGFWFQFLVQKGS